MRSLMGILATALILLAFAAPARADLLTSLEAHWKLNEASGTRLDETANNNDLTDNNTVTQATGKIDNAGQFVRANNEFLSIADNASLSMGDIDFSMACWVYLDTIPSNDYILAKWGGTQNEYTLDYLGGGTDRFRFSTYDGANQRTVTANNFGAVSTGTWYFLYVYHDSVNNEIGISVNDGAVDALANANGVNDSNSDFRIGARVSGGDQYWNGRMDSLSFWKRVLTAQERTDLYNGGSGFDYPFGVGGGARSFGVIIYSASGGIPFGFPLGGLW